MADIRVIVVMNEGLVRFRSSADISVREVETNWWRHLDGDVNQRNSENKVASMTIKIEVIETSS